MATLTPKLTLASTDVSANEVLGLSVGKALTVKPPMKGISRMSCPALGTDDVTILAANALTQYLYIHHTGFQQDGTSATTQYIKVQFGSGPLDTLMIQPNDFAWLPVGNQAVVIESSGNQTILTEYAYLTKA